MNNDQKAIEALRAIQIIKEFMDSEESRSTSSYWEDTKGYAFTTDIGYFFEGLTGMEELLIKRLRGARPDRPRVEEVSE